MGTVYDGSSRDVGDTTWLASDMVMRYGMSKELGIIALSRKFDTKSLFTAPLVWSEELQAKADQLVVDIIQSQYEVSRNILLENRDLLEKLARLLSEEISISGDELREFIRQNK